MLIKALNEGAVGIDIQGLPDGTIVLTATPKGRKEKSSRDKVMSETRSATITHLAALQILQGLIKRDADDFDLELMNGDEGVETEGSITFSLPEPEVFDQMTIVITFGVSDDVAWRVYNRENKRPAAQTQDETQLKGEAEDLENVLPNQSDLGIPPNAIENIELGRETAVFKLYCQGFDYDIQVNFREFLIAMIQAL